MTSRDIPPWTVAAVDAQRMKTMAALLRRPRPAQNLDVGVLGQQRPRVEALWAAIRRILEEAIEAGGSSLRDFAASDGSLGYFQHRFRVYDREGAPCPACARPVRRIVQSGRSTFYCGACQR